MTHLRSDSWLFRTSKPWVYWGLYCVYMDTTKKREKNGKIGLYFYKTAARFGMLK